MKIYLAGDGVCTRPHFPKLCTITKNFLVAYDDVYKEEHIKKIKDKVSDVNLFLDSSAFSVFTGKTKINLYDYIAFLLECGKQFSVVAALDVIDSGEKSMANYIAMRDSGLVDVVPTYHFGEDWEFLKKYVSITDYVGIGGLVRIAGNPVQRAKVIKKALSMVDKHTKVHLFGMTTPILLKLFPHVYSVDSTGWLSGRKFGTLFGSKAKGVFDYNGKQGSGRYTSFDMYNAYQLIQLEREINESIGITH